MPTDDFINGPPTPKTTATTPTDPLIQQLNQLNGRIRSFERSLTELRNLLRFHEERTITSTKELRTKQKDLTDKQHHTEDELESFKHTLNTVITELQLTAKKEDVDVIKRIIDIIKPTRFITQERAEQLIKDIIREQPTPTVEMEWKRKI